MTHQLPAPPVPAEVDLREFVFMPLDVLRLRDSDLAGTPDAEVFRASVLSWCVAWHQVPAASLPDDDSALARLLGYGRDVKTWKKIRAKGGLRGWISCSDGRIYHPVVAEKALEAWTRRDAFQSKKHNEETRQQRWRAELARLCDLLRSHGVAPPKHPTKAHLVDLCRLHVPNFVDVSQETQPSTNVDANRLHVDAGEIGKTGTGTGTGTGQGQDRTGTGHVRGRARLAASEGKPEQIPDLDQAFRKFLNDTYPETAHRCDFVTAFHSAQGIVGSGKATETDLRRRLTGFREFVDAGGYSDRSKIPTPQSWFRLHQQGEAYWSREWGAAPATGKAKPVLAWTPDDDEADTGGARAQA